MELTIFVRQGYNMPESKLTVSVSPTAITLNCKDTYAAKTKRYILDNIVKKFIPDEFLSVKIILGNVTYLKANTVTQPTGEPSVVIQKLCERNRELIEDEYIFVNNSCVFNNGAELDGNLTMSKVIHEYLEKILFSED